VVDRKKHPFSFSATGALVTAIGGEGRILKLVAMPLHIASAISLGSLGFNLIRVCRFPSLVSDCVARLAVLELSAFVVIVKLRQFLL
jgi:hypothetical protein